MWDNGDSRKHCGNQGQWNFPCIIKKGLVSSLCSWEVPLVNPTKVLWLWTPRDEGHCRGSANPLLILSAPLYWYTVSPLTTSRSNLWRFGWVNKFLIHGSTTSHLLLLCSPWWQAEQRRRTSLVTATDLSSVLAPYLTIVIDGRAYLNQHSHRMKMCHLEQINWFISNYFGNQVVFQAKTTNIWWF